MNEFVTVAIIFFALQLLNVILNTAKSLIMARTDNPHMSAMINAVTFGFYTVVVKQIASLDITMTTIVVIVTNVIGVYVTYWIAKKLKKDSLWKIEIYNKSIAPLAYELEQQKIPYAFITAEIVTAYCYTQSDSEKVKKIITADPDTKYNITEITKKF